MRTKDLLFLFAHPPESIHSCKSIVLAYYNRVDVCLEELTADAKGNRGTPDQLALHPLRGKLQD